MPALPDRAVPLLIGGNGAAAFRRTVEYGVGRRRRAGPGRADDGIFGDFADVVAANALRSPDAIRGAIAGFADAGVDEVILDPIVADLEQIDRLADIVL
jgi:hypothetical protein